MSAAHIEDGPLPLVYVLYAENWRENYQPKKAEAALQGKAQAVFVPVNDFTANALSMTIFNMQEETPRPDFFVIDVPNDLPQEKIQEIAYGVRALGEPKSRRVVFGTVKNAAAQEAGFYDNVKLPIVDWRKIAECGRFNSDEIVKQQKKEPSESGFLGALLSKIPLLKHLKFQ